VNLKDNRPEAISGEAKMDRDQNEALLSLILAPTLQQMVVTVHCSICGCLPHLVSHLHGLVYSGVDRSTDFHCNDEVLLMNCSYHCQIYQHFSSYVQCRYDQGQYLTLDIKRFKFAS
jgi:hypothetical protein